MAEPRRLSDLLTAVRARLTLPGGDLVVALSGGADSAALAFMLAGRGLNVRALHVEHGLPGSPLMEKAAIDISDQLDLDLALVRVAVPDGASPEGRARRVRYEAFESALSPGEWLLTGHTRSDNAETILFNIIRGTGSRGLGGIPHYRPPSIVRPMLAVDRSETREIAALAGLGFVDDPMNEEQGLTRNFVRARVTPMLRQMNPRLDEALTRMASMVASDSEYLDRLAKVHESREGLAIGALLTLPRPVADRLLKGALGEAADEAEVTARRLERVWGVVRGDASSAEMGEGIRAWRSGPYLRLSGPDEPRRQVDVVLAPGTHSSGGIEFDVARMDDRCRVIPLSRWSAVFPADTELVCREDGVVTADGEPAWVPGERRFPVAWYTPGTIGYLSVLAREKTEWTSSR